VHLNLCWVLRQLGDLHGAVAAGRRAVELMPDHLHAYNYLVLALLASGEHAAALEVCDASLRLNPRNTSALAYRPAALVGLGRQEEAEALVDFERLLWQGELEVDDLAELNAALVEHALAAPTRPFDDTQTIDLFASPRGPVPRLERILNEAIQRYLAALPHDPSHPYLSVRPRAWKLDGWGTLLRAMGEQEHHFHQHGWVSGVYYAKLPKFVGSPETGLAGCIEFCRFPRHSRAGAHSDFVAVKPTQGLLLLFPSYFYHRVVPFGECPEMRVSIAFNAMPTA
jgi:tetratricopeptide (TPR) repeat protein